MARKLHGRMRRFGLDISIENRAGSVRYWQAEDGERGQTKMLYPYGYVRGSIGRDGDHVDVFVGPNDNSAWAFVIDQMKRPKFETLDEQKVMLGFDSAAEAKRAYLAHFNDARFFGKMKAMPIGQFRSKVLGTSESAPLVRSGVISLDEYRALSKAKAAPVYVGPKGGKYSDPQRTKPYKVAHGPSASDFRKLFAAHGIHVLDVQLSHATSGPHSAMPTVRVALRDEKEADRLLRVAGPKSEMTGRKAHVGDQWIVMLEKRVAKSDVGRAGPGILLTQDVVERRIRALKNAGQWPDDRTDNMLVGKRGPYVGPKGGKWQDPQHTIPWKEGRTGTQPGAAAHDKMVRDMSEKVIALWRERKLGHAGDITLPRVGKLGDLKVGVFVRRGSGSAEINYHTGKRSEVPGDPRYKGWAIIIDLPVGVTAPGEKGERFVRRALSHEMTHAREMVTPEKAWAAARKTLNPGGFTQDYRKYRNSPGEVTAFIHEMHRDITDAPSAAKVRAWHEGGREQPFHEMLAEVAEGWAKDWRVYDEKNAKRILRAAFDTVTAVLEGRVGDIKKAGPYIGPRGGKWADAKHTIPWKPGEQAQRADVTKTEAFKRWFGDSKITDDNGKPLRVYHGTPTAGFSSFDTKRGGSNTGSPDAAHSISFTTQPETAGTYSRSHDLEFYERAKQALGREPGTGAPKHESATYPVYLRVTNPLVVTDNKKWNTPESIAEAKRKGHDGMIRVLYPEGGSAPKEMQGETEITVFDPKQIKSAVGNVTFDPKSADIGKSYRVIDIETFAKATAKPKGAGWQIIPRGRKGGMRRRTARGWEYWYPTQFASGKPSQQPVKWTEKRLRDGDYDTDPKNWEPIRAVGGVGVIPWVQGGVIPDSAHPVKIAGRAGQIFRIVGEHSDGWAELKDVNSDRREVVPHDRIYPVEYGPGAKPKASVLAPGTDVTATPKGPQAGVSKSKGRKMPAFPGSRAKPGTTLWKVENGHYPIRTVVRYVNDASDDKPHRRTESGMWMPDSDKLELIKNYRGLITNTAKRLAQGHGIDITPDRLADLKSAGMEGLLTAIRDYEAKGPFTQAAKTHIQDHIRMQLVRDFEGSVTLPKRRARLLRGYIAARAQAVQAFGTTSPTTEQVASVWKVKKYQLHAGMKSGAQKEGGGGGQDIPLKRYSLTSGQISSGKDHPGKLELAEQLEAYLQGQRDVGDLGSSEGEEVFSAAPTVGAGMSEQERAVFAHQISVLLDSVENHRSTIGRFEYRTNAAEIVRRRFGLQEHERPEELRTVARAVPVYRLSRGGEWARLSDRRAAEVIDPIIDDVLKRMRSEQEDSDELRALERAQAMTRQPTETRAAGPTMRQNLQAEAKAISRERVREWRRTERARIERMVDVYEQGDDPDAPSKAAYARRLRSHIDNIGLKQARLHIAMLDRLGAPRSREWFRNAEPIPVDVTGHALLTDPDTGKQRRVFIAGMRKAERDDPLAVHLGLAWPLLARTLFATDDPLAVGPSPERDIVLSMLLGQDDAE